MTGLIFTLIAVAIRFGVTAGAGDSGSLSGGQIALTILALLLSVIGIIITLKSRKSRVFAKIIFLILHVALFLFGHYLVAAIMSLLAIAFLCVVAYIYFDGSSGSSAKTSHSGRDPMQEYRDERDPRRMPSCIYDDSGDRWDKQYATETFAVYSNYDKGQVTIHYCDNRSQYASGGGYTFKWY